MFRIPNSVLTETIILQPATQTGLGIVLNEDDPVTFKVALTREAKWTHQKDGSLIQDIIKVVSNSPIPVGSILELSDGERVEVKSLTTIKMGRVRSGYQMVCW